jgi:hypothetical protein
VKVSKRRTLINTLQNQNKSDRKPDISASDEVNDDKTNA